MLDAAYVCELKPRQIYALYPNIFSDVKEIHRIKENILTRLRRDDSLKNYLGK
ncbi:MAG: hypothetical protein R2911_26265 [Caldilineaceae bacterium]